MTLDAAVVYLHVVTPRDLRGSLPSLANDWKDFLQAQHWQRRWVASAIADRRQPAMRFIDSIRRSDAQPTLYYLHALLPHEPFIYMRTGQQFTRETALPGLTPRWTAGYRRSGRSCRPTSATCSRWSMRTRSSSACCSG